MSKRIQFNTGRRYTAEGQRIVAILHDDGVVTFMDHDRMIGGEFKAASDDLSKAEVMQAYDGHHYHMSSRAMSAEHRWQD